MLFYLTNLISHLFGIFARISYPRFFAQFVMRTFCKLYNVNLDESEFELIHYKSLADFFVRDLKAGARPISQIGAGQIVCPVDGKLRDFGQIQQGRIPQVKGRDYKIENFLGKEFSSLYSAEKFQYFLNFYLSPPDYHHIHAPIAGKIKSIKKISGYLFPVNNWGLNNIDQLFCVNERVVCLLETQMGLVAVVMVGALNVGQIQIHVNENQEIQAGQKIGTFHLGSSVVLLLENPMEVEVGREAVVRFGQKLKN